MVTVTESKHVAEIRQKTSPIKSWSIYLDDEFVAYAYLEQVAARQLSLLRQNDWKFLNISDPFMSKVISLNVDLTTLMSPDDLIEKCRLNHWEIKVARIGVDCTVGRKQYRALFHGTVSISEDRYLPFNFVILDEAISQDLLKRIWHCRQHLM